MNKEQFKAIIILLIVILLMIWYFAISTISNTFPTQHQITSICVNHDGLQQVYSTPPLGRTTYVICKDGYGDFAP